MQTNQNKNYSAWATSVPLMGIPVLNRGDLLCRLLESIDFPVNHLFLINNGRDESVRTTLNRVSDENEPLRRFIKHVTIVDPGCNLGVAASFNMFIREFTQSMDYLMLVGSDIQFSAGDIKKMHESVQSHYLDPVSCNNATLFHGNHDYSFFCLTHDVVDAVGTFDENIYPAYLEDCDYTWRMKLASVNTVKVAGTNAIHGEAPNWGSSTIHSDTRLLESNHLTHRRNFEYYKRKWGGINGKEIYKYPFNDPNKTHKFWELDLEWRKGNSIWLY